MSFRDLGTSSFSARSQPRTKRDEETSYERSIKENIQELQDSVRRANEQLEQAQRSFLSKRIADSLDRFLERSQQLSQETERLFRDWTVHLAGEPAERHRKKFSYEKLQKAFEEEAVNLKDVARRTLAAQQEANNLDRGGSLDSRPLSAMCEEQGGLSVCGESDVEYGLLEESAAQVSRMAQQEDVTIRNRIVQEREEGIRRIQSQVHEVNQIFRDLASIVHEQDHHIDSIERTAESASGETKQASSELKKASDRQRGSRERLCCMLTAAVILLFLIVLPHMHMTEMHGFEHVPAAGSSGSSAAAPPPPAAVATPLAPAGWKTPVIGVAKSVPPNLGKPVPANAQPDQSASRPVIGT